jgi:ubiquinone/menaquinone biosynthesis C-methylase UbiE
MPDLYTRIAEAPPAVLESLMAVLERRAADPQQRAMLAAYLGDLALPPGARVLEVGCGTGAVTRALAALPGVAQAIGVDPSAVFVERARALGTGHAALRFEIADGRSLPFADDDFDVVVFHTTLCHVPQPELMLREAARVLRVAGCLAVFDGDYATATLAIGPGDPLEACAEAFCAHFVHDPWLARRLPALIQAVGLRLRRLRSFGYVEALEPGFMLPSWVDLGADALAAAGQIGPEAAAGLKSEARRRILEGRYFGHIAYLSVVACKPG